MTMNQEQTNQVPSTLIPVKRVRTETGKGKKGDQEQIVLTFGLNKEGGNDLDTLIDTLQEYRGKQINFDVRISEKTSERGTKFPSAFVLVKEMIPRNDDAGGVQRTTTFTKKPSRQDKIKAEAKKFEKGIE